MKRWLGKFLRHHRVIPACLTASAVISRIVLSTVLIMPAYAVQSVTAAEPVLMVGNSFTGETYKQITDRAIFKERWVGGYNLDDHFRNPESLASICNGRALVLLQDFSTRTRTIDLFLFDMDEMIPYVRSCKAQPVLFMTWETTSVDFTTVRNGYVQAALRHNVQIVPVGLVFNRVRAASESMYQSFIQPDGKHPTVRGSKVSAASIMKAFCEDCYQRFNWSGFNASEINMIKSIINTNVTSIVLNETFEEETVPEDQTSSAYLGAIVAYLLGK